MGLFVPPMTIETVMNGAPGIDGRGEGMTVAEKGVVYLVGAGPGIRSC